MAQQPDFDNLQSPLAAANASGWLGLTQLMKNYAKELKRHAVIAWRGFATGERRTAWGLLKQGFMFHCEPKFVSGMTPDFFTYGRGRMWVEVKEFDQPESQALLGFAWDQLSERLAPFTGQCRVDAWVSDEFDERVARLATHLLAVELRAGLPEGQDLYLAVPAGEITNDIVSLEWTGHEGDVVRMVAYRSLDGIYGCPASAEPAEGTTSIRIIDNGVESQLPAHRVLSEDRPARALLHVDSSHGERVLRGVGGAQAHSVRTVDRMRHVIAHANRQLRNGQKHRAAPGLLVLYNDHLGGGDHTDVLRACFGDLTVLVRPQTSGPSSGFYGRNGVLRQNKNTAISAIEYRSRVYPTVCLVNPFALYQIDHSWLTDRVYHVDAEGHVHSI